MRKDITDLSGGMNNQVSPLLIKDNQCEIVQNYHVDEIGSLKKRDGLANLIGQVVNNVSILGLYYFKDAQGTDYSSLLVACDDAASPTNSDVFNIETNAWAISLADDTKSVKPEFSTFVDKVFRTNGADKVKVTDDLATWNVNGADGAAPDLTPKYVKVWEDRVYVANENGATKYPSRLYWSSLPSGTPLTVTWTPATNYADINPDDNDIITWIEPFGKKLLVFKEFGLYRWTFGQVEPDKIIDVGTPQGRTVKQSHGICFFANRAGVWAYTTGFPKLISNKVKPWIKAISDLDDLRAEVDEDHYYLWIGNVTVRGTAYTNIMLVYTLSTDSWTIRKYPFVVTAMARGRRKTLGSTEIYDAVYLGDDDGYVYRMDTGTIDYNGTTATPISGYIQSKNYTLDYLRAVKLKELFVVAQQASGVQVSYRINKGEWKNWKDLKKWITEASLYGRARSVQLSFGDNSQTQSQIDGFSLDFVTDADTRRESESKRRQN